jgi:ABC-type nickel/cobalt efflux system permease component RcnA
MHRVNVGVTLGLLVLLFIGATAGAWAHWADLAAADITVRGQDVRVTLTYPTGLIDGLDDDHNGTLDDLEVNHHRDALLAAFKDRLSVHDANGQAAKLTTVECAADSLAPGAPRSSHTTVRLLWHFDQAATGMVMHYGLFFVPKVSTARCVATVDAPPAFTEVVFTPDQPDAPLGNAVASTAAAPRSTMARRLDLSQFGWELLLVAFVLGALHAFSPGHGKTVVGAYLVGSRGTVWHAILLGALVTFTHTISVIALGVGCLFVFQKSVPDSLYPWLGFVSGLLISLMGIVLLRSQQRSSPRHHHAHRHHHHHHDEHHHDDHHHHDHSHHHSHHGHHEHGHHEHHEHAHHHSHHERHEHTHHHGHHGHHRHHEHHEHAHHTHHHDGHVHTHDHSHEEHGHVHSHGGREHSHALPERITLMSLIALGVSGGIVPCPDALVVLLSAIAMKKILLGIIVLIAFSLGIATVLMGIGIGMVTAGRLFERFYPAQHIIRNVTQLSYMVIVVLGFVVAWQSLAAGNILPLQ